MAELRLYPLWVEACFAALAGEAGAEGVEWLPLASVFANLGMPACFRALSTRRVR